MHVGSSKPPPLLASLLLASYLCNPRACLLMSQGVRRSCFQLALSGFAEFALFPRPISTHLFRDLRGGGASGKRVPGGVHARVPGRREGLKLS